ncbi:hypothetical protein [Flavobacterium sp. H122]|uniref:hypothetical protein n=1 Tax=Flavobacterium sp. H122 TaxID=2529860 RepID=UPI0010AACF50|nr:hypothetical protein [Flavobacterium sp. H122]
MKKNTVYYLWLFFLSGFIAYSQVPQKISYQSVVRNASNQLLQNNLVGVKISILQGNISGTSVYSETHLLSTNNNGLLSLEIGGGAVVSGVFNSINWANGPYFIKSEIDPAGGTNYTITGASQLLSVPYAQLAENVVNPKFSVSVSDESSYDYWGQTTRNTWIDDPDIALVVPETGKYLLIFSGKAYNVNTYLGTPGNSFDTNCLVRVFNSSTENELNYSLILQEWSDTDVQSNYIVIYKLMPMNSEKSMLLNLTQGDILKLQYNQVAVGNPTTSWYILGGNISILKIGN